jgi:S-DNA-T family DNA segregation ATPase FtsK/SpoIIIE
MVFGDAETGKTNLLRLIARSVAARYGPDEARVMLADPRRDLFDAVPQEMQLGFAVSASALSDMVKEAAGSLAERLPGPDVTPEQLKARDWWGGPRLFLIIDDYDLLASSGNCPIQALEDLLPQAADIGLHVIVARSTSSASRGMMDRALRRMQEIGTPALLLSCPRDEGQFLGDTKPLTLPTGRAQLVQRRRRPMLVQTARVAAAAEDSLPEVA